MRKSLFLFTVCLFLTEALFSQKIGEWRSYFSYEGNIDLLAQGDDNVFAVSVEEMVVQQNPRQTVSSRKLFSYSPEDDTFETYVKVGENDIVAIEYSKKSKCLVVVRSNGDIDLLYQGGNLSNIPDLKNLAENLDKTVNDVYIKDDLAYISLNFGLIVINTAKQEIKESLILRYPIYSASIYNENLFIATSKGVKMIDPKKNIQNINGWDDISLQSINTSTSNLFSDSEIRQLRDFDNKLTFIVPGKGFYLYDSNSVSFLQTVNSPQKMVYSNSGILLSGTSSSINLLKLSQSEDNIQLNMQTACIVQDKKQANVYWAGIAGKNLVKLTYSPTEKTVTIAQEYMKPNGPLTNYPFSLTYEQGKLLLTGGGESGNALGYPGRLSEYSNDQWLNYDVQEATNAINAINPPGTNWPAEDYISAAVDPNNPNRIFVCTWRSGLLVFKDKKLEQFYNQKNSHLLPAYSYYVRIGGGVFDKAGNYWFMNNDVNKQTIINVIKAGSTEITSVNEAIADGPVFRSMIVDKYNRKWMSGRRRGGYLRVFESNSALDKFAKTRVVLSGGYTSQDGEKLGIDYFNSVVEDLNGNIWLGTDVGIFVVYNRSDIFNSEIDLVFNKIKVPRNDGTNIIDILLDKMVINTIAVDGANRKWVGTKTSGVYVVSGNGQEAIHHFNSENSLLPSDEILSIAIDDKSGIVYIGTAKGIVSYRNEATEGAESYSNVYAFPNPVEPDYQGPITIVGLMSNSIVKITDLKGNLINEGKSLGGQYIWDGRNKKRERVETGVYLVLGSSEDESKGVVAKIMVITN